MHKIQGIFVGILLVGSCVSKQKQEEPLPDHTIQPREYGMEFGFLYNPANRLIAKPDGAIVEICGPSQFSEIKKAILVWAKVIGRNLNIINSCKNPSISNYTRADPETVKATFEWPFLIARWNANNLAFVSGDGTKLYNTMDRPMPWPIILHEAGHLWGLCDQDKGQISNCARTTMPVLKSVMLNPVYNELQEDDIQGLKNLALDFKRIPSDVTFLTRKELDEYVQKQELQPSEKSRWQLCGSIKNQPHCELNDCIWDRKNHCLSSLLSSCSSATSEKACKQILACRWQFNECMFSPQI